MKHDDDNAAIHLGFWLYLMTDCLLFAALFATYAVLHGGTNGDVTSSSIISMPYVLAQTILLLASSLAAGIAYIHSRAGQWSRSAWWLIATMTTGLAFLAMELNEFVGLLREDLSWQTSAFLSAFFTLIATHGAHILAGLIWAAVLVALIYRRRDPSRLAKNMLMFTLFWHFLEIVWVCIFTFVYAMGSLS